uniref:Uncharacterized protein n=1 Tax=Arundo donax TaxID=35708 RepID=A0A0A9D943_ARUDO
MGTQKNGKNDTTDKMNRPSSELFDRDGFPGNLIGILLPQLLHASNKAHLVGLCSSRHSRWSPSPTRPPSSSCLRSRKACLGTVSP